ncbi:hypothetical protein GC173_16200 [bacterium]|nr:hypothetical protein [bacterium]
MMPIRMMPLVAKYIVRHRARSLLTITGVGVAMFLFCAVSAMRNGVDDVTRRTADETRLIVYRKNRFCPFTSKLPEDYSRRIAALPGVASVTPMSIVVNNCRASLDVVTFRGIPRETLEADPFPLLSGSMGEWTRRSDAALIGERLATRRGLSVGDRLDAAGIVVTVAGVLKSDDPQDENVAYVHLDFLQRAAGNTQGIVTQFNVQAADSSLLDSVAASIDETFAHAQDPTWTTSEKAYSRKPNSL